MAVCALALLAADAASDEHPEYFRLSASFSLQGPTDELVGLFLELPDQSERARRQVENQRRQQAERDGKPFTPDPTEPKPYLVCFLDEFPEASLVARGGLTDTVAGQVASISELIRRELLLPDHAVARFGGVSCPFGIGEVTQRYLQLLDLTKRYVEL